MTDDPQPELRWAPMDPPPRNRGRVWLIVGLVVAALVVVGVLLFFLLPRDGATDPESSASPSPSASTSPSPSPTMTTTASPEEPEPSMTPITTPPPPADPEVATFRAQMQEQLDVASTRIDLAAQSSGQEATDLVNLLRADAQRLADTPPPSSIATAWSDAVTAYGARLDEWYSAAAANTDTTGAARSTRDALAAVRDVIAG